ncbi:hypothetical protein [Nannocystis pusilla]|uniref:hypothetical protein n=1 Tax=Nannocystis pusilla TaxID=889268 RepID=UPI003B7F203A
MSSLIDCPECACLFRASDATCPFCGHVQRHSLGATWAAVAFTASLGVMGAACQVDRDIGDETSATAGDTVDTADTVDTSMVSESTNPGGDTVDPTITTTSSDGATYAGPDEEWDTWGTPPPRPPIRRPRRTPRRARRRPRRPTAPTTRPTPAPTPAPTRWSTSDWTTSDDSSDASTYAGADSWEPNDQGR